MSIFDTVQNAPNHKRNKFDLSRENLFTTNFGCLVPIMCEPLLPGDTFKLNPSAIVKTAPMLAPLYGQINVDIHCFVVPLRLLWREFDKWIYDPTNTENVPPHAGKQVLCSAATHTNLLGYLGIPSATITSKKQLNIFKILGYHQIWKEYFRDEDLTQYPDFLDDNTIQDYNDYFRDNVNGPFLCGLHQRAWRKDYFTSARPWPQKGTPPVLSLFQNEEIPVYMHVADTNLDENTQQHILFWQQNNSAENLTSARTAQINFPASVPNELGNVDNVTGNASWFWSAASAAGVDVAQLRSLFAVQKFLELSATVGSRYIEGNLAYFGTKIKDYRAQIPEFLGYTSQVLHIDEIVQTSETDVTRQGHRTGQGSTAFRGKSFKYFNSEHSLVYVLFSIRPRSVYSQGLSRYWSILDQLDFPNPLFQSIGEQEIKQQELCILNGDTDIELEKTFGYQSRYAEMRSSFDEVHGDFADSLNFWHLGRLFDVSPNLDDDFIYIQGVNDTYEEDNPLNRVFAVTDGKTQHFWCDAWLDFQVKRKLHYHTVPALIG